MQKPHDDSKACPAAFVQDSTLVVVIEMSLSSWFVAGMIPGVSRDPLKKIDPNPDELLKLLHRWRDEAIQAGKEIITPKRMLAWIPTGKKTTNGPTDLPACFPAQSLFLRSFSSLSTY
jgi:hypothetical protein